MLGALWQTVLIPWTIHPPCSPRSSKIESGRQTAIGTGNAQHIGRVSTHRKASLWAAKLKHWGQRGASHGGGNVGLPTAADDFRLMSLVLMLNPRWLPSVQETQVQSLGREDPLEKAMAIHSSILAWRIPWTEEPGGLQSTGSKRVGTQLSD